MPSGLTLFTTLRPMVRKHMTEPLFLDTDCLSTFLIVQRENLILQLYAGRIGIEFDYSFCVHELTNKNICASIRA